MYSLLPIVLPVILVASTALAQTTGEITRGSLGNQRFIQTTTQAPNLRDLVSNNSSPQSSSLRTSLRAARRAKRLGITSDSAAIDALPGGLARIRLNEDIAVLLPSYWLGKLRHTFNGGPMPLGVNTKVWIRCPRSDLGEIPGGPQDERRIQTLADGSRYDYTYRMISPAGETPTATILVRYLDKNYRELSSCEVTGPVTEFAPEVAWRAIWDALDVPKAMMMQ